MTCSRVGSEVYPGDRIMLDGQEHRVALIARHGGHWSMWLEDQRIVALDLDRRYEIADDDAEQDADARLHCAREVAR